MLRRWLSGRNTDSHAALVCRALTAGKDVFVEKPLALRTAEVDEIEETYHRVSAKGEPPRLMVGFNRRFSPQVQKICGLLAGVGGSKSLVMTVNAGAIPASHWTQDAELGGGRIIGEACHFVDLLRFLAGARIVSHHANYMQSPNSDTASLSLSFEDGSIGTVHYFANGNRAFPKERLEIFAGGRILQLDNFRKLTGYGWKGFKTMNLWRQDKGQKACAAEFVKAVQAKAASPIPFEELIEVARVTIDLDHSKGALSAGSRPR